MFCQQQLVYDEDWVVWLETKKEQENILRILSRKGGMLLELNLNGSLYTHK